MTLAKMIFVSLFYRKIIIFHYFDKNKISFKLKHWIVSNDRNLEIEDDFCSFKNLNKVNVQTNDFVKD